MQTDSRAVVEALDAEIRSLWASYRVRSRVARTAADPVERSRSRMVANLYRDTLRVLILIRRQGQTPGVEEMREELTAEEFHGA
jgi:hypothetical protein